MEVKVLDKYLVKKMFLAAAANLAASQEWINELNVFPVPDGDTGTNMTMTITSAANAVTALGDDFDMNQLAKAISSGSLRGARGNSGVILSQLLRGFSKAITDHEEIDATVLNDAMQRAVDAAFKAVMKPKEGTILTVAKAVQDRATYLFNSGNIEDRDITYFINELIIAAEDTLAKTPDMLPVLKEAGVVDSGGQGLVMVLKGAQAALLGREIDITAFGEGKVKINTDDIEIDEADIKFGYCTEFIINLANPVSNETVLEYKAYLESIGDSIVVVADDDLIKTHVHTNDPGMAITKALSIGESLSKIKIDNMREEHHERLIENASKKAAEAAKPKKAPITKEMGFVSIATGEGFCQLFKDYGVDNMIEGGQTMNPSTDDILAAVDKTGARTVFVLPNNKNIILAAEQASKLCEDKNIVVIPTKTVCQGITALLSFMEDVSVEDNTEALTEAISTVKTGQLTYAVRDTSIDGKEIKINDYMGMGDAGLISVNADRKLCFQEMVDDMIDHTSAVVTIYYGEGVTEAEANEMAAYVMESNPGLEACDVVNGGQSVYHYIVSVE